MRSVKSYGGLSRGRGMDENTITMWIHLIHCFADIHSAVFFNR